MKSESATFKNIQFPFTFFGVSLKLLVLVLVFGLVMFVALFLIDLLEYALPVTVIFFVVSWLKLFRTMQKNPHFESSVFKSPLFWRSKSEVTLVTGQPPLKHKGGKR